jgi:hypothetical protein
MSSVEALLSVDAGRVPPGTIAFFQRDPDGPRRRSCAWLAIIIDGFALALVIAGVSKMGAALLALSGVALALGAIPTKSEEDRPRKPPTLVVTPEGIVVRDENGMRYWHFDDLADAKPYADQTTSGLLIVRKNGKRDFVDTTLFERGEKVRDAIGHWLKVRAALPLRTAGI